jgi:ferredoxin
MIYPGHRSHILNLFHPPHERAKNSLLKTMSSYFAAALILLLVGAPRISNGLLVPHKSITCYRARSSSLDMTKTVVLSLEKPMGLILEESDTASGGGVYVKEFGETGSALPFAEQIRGAQVLAVGPVNVRSASFDAVMDLVVQNESPTIDMEFQLPPPPPAFSVGTPVTVTVQRPNDSLTINAAVGDNLRKVLLDNGVEVYQGLQQTLGNCGGAGQCTFCAVDLIESEGWDERSDYEDKRLKRFPSARLACLNSIQGPATIQKTKR